MNEMHTITLQGGDITLTSTWTYGTTDYGKLYTAPSTVYDALTFDLSSLPEGCILHSARLSCQRYGVGEIRTMDGTDADSKDIDISRLTNSETLRLVFAYQAFGSVGAGTGGTLSATAGWMNIRLTLVYSMPYTAPTAPTMLSVSETEAHPGQALTLSWSGAQAGNRVDIAGHAVYCAAGSGEAVLISQTQQTHLSVSAPLSACSVRYRIQTLGSVPGYDSTLSSASAQVTVAVSPPLPPVQLSLVPASAAPGTETALQWSGALPGQNNALRGFAIEIAGALEGEYRRLATVEGEGGSGTYSVTVPEEGTSCFRIVALGQWLDSVPSAPVSLSADWSGTSDFAFLETEVEAGGTVTLTLLSNLSCTHTLRVAIGEQTETRSYPAGTETISFSPPLSWLCQMPDRESAPLSFLLETQGGGRVQRTLPLRCPSGVVPTLFPCRIEKQYGYPFPGWDTLIAGKSAVRLCMENAAAQAYSSPIVHYEIRGMGKQVQGDSLPLCLQTDVLPEGEVLFTLLATDARGRVGSCPMSLTVSRYEAQRLSNIVTVRCDAQSEEAEDGDWILASATVHFAPVSGHNSASVQLSYQKQGDGVWTDAGEMENGQLCFGNGQIDLRDNYEIRYTVTDALGETAVYHDLLTRAMPQLHVRSGGGAWAFGGIADEEGALKVYGDIVATGKITALQPQITYGTAALTAGESSLAEGVLYLQYE